ncbi:ATP-binding protein [Flavitalea sp. BT771]|uniref:ATP-binding protein n=1 Tax=Flavitalea sp. BT771 TaxID=3063329 RepID=UPI0026E1717C|nr:ATP-binding protein [Flavitalea sp. BT771]MDO6430454.1 ATP-binding protein [Flavitalea sp. BT771]MDV6219406.1 ATP-binding protein [Flavitalea sp. BT771]
MTQQMVKDKLAATPEFLAGGGEMGQRIREYDWSKTPLGPISDWPQNLRTCIRIMLTSRQPIWMGWGKELIKLYNDPYKAIVGGKHPWALGEPASLVWKDIWRDIGPMLRQVMEKDEGTYVESQLLVMERNGYPEETYYTFSYTPIPGDDGATAGMICFNTDDTERIISERQLKTLTRLGKSLTDSRSNKDIIERTITTLGDNPHDFPFILFYTLSGDRATLSGTTSLGGSAAIVPAEIDLTVDDPQAFPFQQAAATRRSQLFEGIHDKMGLMPKGAWEVAPDKAFILPIASAGMKEPFGFLVVGNNPYRLPDEKYRSFFSLIADQIATSFSDIHALEEERKRSEALAEIDRAKTIFFSNISHEFRTPLTLLLGPIEEVLNDPQSVAVNKYRMGIAHRNALRMQKLVNTLLEFSRIESGRQEGKFSRVDICSFTKDLASSFRSAIEKAGMQLHISCGEIGDEVYVDVDMWEMIVLNLISNAFKYSHQGTIDVGVRQQGKEVLVTVADAGAGIPEDQLEKIFQRFHRISDVQGRSLEGTGIGLAMVKELVKLHKGSITVESRLGEGSTFTVTLPVGKDHLPEDRIGRVPFGAAIPKNADAFVMEALKWIPDEQGAPGTWGSGDDASEQMAVPATIHPHTVLLADDNADMRDYVGRLLSSYYNVVTAMNGEDAFEKMVHYKPDLLLSDVMMPRLDGFGLLKKIREHPEIKNIPVILLSARAGEEAKVEGLDAGADDYLTKPFSARELLARVDASIKIAKNRITAEDNLRSIILQSPVATALFRGPSLTIELANERMLDIWGRSSGEVINQTAALALPEIMAQGFDKILSTVYATGKAHQGIEVPIDIRHPNGIHTFYFDFIYEPLWDEHHHISGIIAVATDVSAQVSAKNAIRRQTEILEQEVKSRTQELSQLNISLRRSNDDLQQFAHVASHDLKEPVRKIRTFGSRLQDEYGHLLPEKGRLFLEKIHHATERMFSMIDGVLTYSMLNGLQQSIETVDLNEVFRNIESDLEVFIVQKQGVIRKGSLPAIEGSPVLIYQLFYNLLNNALKFSRSGVPPVVHISSRMKDDDGRKWVEIGIADNGIGFDQKYAASIFDTFARLNSKDKYEGTGLGLALCKKIVERHHGTITALGTKNTGAAFTIRLPERQTENNI